jgi:hypothetical protein
MSTACYNRVDMIWLVQGQYGHTWDHTVIRSIPRRQERPGDIRVYIALTETS